MSITEATYVTDLHEWLPAQAERYIPCTQVKALKGERDLRSTCCIACFRCVMAAS